jgi:transcriptional regulator with GAF, ATPase, and Fis domain
MGEIIGTIYVDDRRTTHFFHQRDVDFLQSLGDMASLAIQNACLFEKLEVANRRLEEEARDLRRQVHTKDELQGMIGRHESMKILHQVIEKVAQTDASVLIRGENGSGKELVARAIYYLSDRKEEPFVVVNCAAIPESLLESEIFGIEKGTATGVERRLGKFEQADGGTLLLDEIGDMSPSIQAKLLRVLQEKRFQRLGGKKNIAVDVKILSATNKDLDKAIKEGWFREDLYYRLNALPVFVPPLRDRIEDLPLLVEHFLRRWSEENDKSLPSISRSVMKILSEYSWPGNIRQLKNVIERMALLCSGGVLGVEDLPSEILARDGSERKVSGELKNLREFVAEYVWKVYLECGKSKKRTCKVLGITYKTLQSYLKKKMD